MHAIQNHVFRLKHRPVGMSSRQDFDFSEEQIPELQVDQVLVKVIYLSLDPTNRIWMSDMPQYMEPVAIGEVMRGLGWGVVVESRSDQFAIGDQVSGLLGWQEYSVTSDRDLQKLPDTGAPLDAYCGPLGMTGWTAYFGLLEIGKPQPGETVVVSAAAGAVGSVVGQIAKLKGCHVVGIAGSEEKCRWIREDLGFDAAINYKSEDIGAALDRSCPRGIDVYFENVGGAVLDEVLKRVNLFARIPLCGLISAYNATEPVPGPSQFVQVLMKRVLLQGFIVFDFAEKIPQAVADLAAWLQAGKLKYRTTVVNGLENAPEAMNMLFEGKNVGKLVVQVGDLVTNPEQSPS